MVADILNRIRNDIFILYHHTIMKSLFIESNLPRHKNIIVGVIYRKPNQISMISSLSLKMFYRKLILNINRFYIMGDFTLIS